MRLIYPNPVSRFNESMIHIRRWPSPCLSQLREERDFGFDVKQLGLAAVNDRTGLDILNSPSNPPAEYSASQAIHDIAGRDRRRNSLVLSDEIYSRLIFEGEHFSIMSIPGFRERTILLDGFFETMP